jgi:hypothetical protein
MAPASAAPFLLQNIELAGNDLARIAVIGAKLHESLVGGRRLMPPSGRAPAYARTSSLRIGIFEANS